MRYLGRCSPRTGNRILHAQFLIALQIETIAFRPDYGELDSLFLLLSAASLTSWLAARIPDAICASVR